MADQDLDLEIQIQLELAKAKQKAASGLRSQRIAGTGSDSVKVAPPKEAPSDWNVKDDLVSPLVRGPLETGAFVTDMLGYPLRKGLEQFTGGKPIETNSSELDRLLTEQGLPDKPGLSSNVMKNILPVSKTKMIMQALQGIAAGAGVTLAEVVAPNSKWAPLVGSLVGGASVGAAEKTLSNGVTRTAGDVATELRNIVPDALTSPTNLQERTNSIVSGLETRGQQAYKDADELYQNLGIDEIDVSSGIDKANAIVANRAGALDPSNPVGKYGSAMDSRTPPDVTTVAPDQFEMSGLQPTSKATDVAIPGGPNAGPSDIVMDMTPGATTVAPGGPPKMSFKEFRVLKNDLSAEIGRATGVHKTQLMELKKHMEGMIKDQVDPAIYAKYEEANAAWKKMRETWDDGAVGSARESLKDPRAKLQEFRNLLLNDPKATEQLVAVMSPEELMNAKNLVFTDLLQKAPTSWATRITANLGSYQHLFGKEGADRLLDMLSREGTVGQKLLSDGAGLQKAITKPLIRATGAIGLGAAGGFVVGGPLGTGLGILAATLYGGVEAKRSAQSILAKELIFKAAAGSPAAVKLLNSPAAKADYTAVWKTLMDAAKQVPEEEKPRGPDSPPVDKVAIAQQMGQQVFGGTSSDQQNARLAMSPPMQQEPMKMPRSPELVLADPNMAQALMSQVSPDVASILQDSIARKDPLAMEAAVSVAMAERPDLFEPSITGLASEMVRGNDIVLTNPTEGKLYGQTMSSMYHQGTIDANFLAEQISLLNNPSHMKIMPRPDQMQKMQSRQPPGAKMPTNQLSPLETMASALP